MARTESPITQKIDEAIATCPTDPNQLEGDEAVALARKVLAAVIDNRHLIRWDGDERSTLNTVLNMLDQIGVEDL